MKTLTVVLLVILSFSCREVQKKTTPQDEENGIVLNVAKESSNQNFTYKLDTLPLLTTKFNKKRLFVNLKDLGIKKADSLSYSLWECGHPLEWLDKEHAVDSLRNIYFKGSRYITNENSVLLIESKMKGNELNIYNKEILNEHSTLKDFERLFPVSYDTFLKTKSKFPNNYKDRLYIDVGFTKYQPEDHWIFYFDNNGYLVRFELYWWLC